MLALFLALAFSGVREKPKHSIPLAISMPKGRYYELAGVTQDKKWLVALYLEDTPRPSHLMAVSLSTGERRYLVRNIVEAIIAK